MGIHKPKRRPLILWSGGLDSTYSILSYLSRTSVDLLIVGGNRFSEEALKAEKRAQEKILAEIERLHLEGFFKYRIGHVYHYDVSVNPNTTSAIETGYGQFLYWLFAAAEVVRPDTHNRVIVSYVAGDMINPMCDRMRKAWKNIIHVHKHTNRVKLEFPMIFVRKEAMLSNLSHPSYQKIIDALWYCETPKVPGNKKSHKPCKECVSCKRMEALLKKD